jgi:hypothetical protein
MNKSRLSLDDLEVRLAAREAALGLSNVRIGHVPHVPTDAIHETSATTDEVSEPEQPQRPPPMRDRFGNRILDDPPGRLGQYRIVSARDGGVAHVCGEAKTTKHLPFWEYDAGERRYVCRVCWPTSQQSQSQPIDE